LRAVEGLTVVSVGAAFLVAGTLVPLLVRFAVGRNLLDVPNLRSSHEVPTPRLGGVAIILGTWVGFALLRPEGAWPLLVAATLIGAVGLADDLGNLHVGTKAAAQTLVASGLLIFYPPQILSEVPGAWGIAAFAVGVFWIVALSNAFNFMDGIDGFMGGIALITVLFLTVLVGEAGGFLPALAGATAGFLVWNISPASIFLGDSGAYFLGFGLAAVALYAPVSDARWTPLGFVACALVFTPLLFDTAYTLVRRLRTGAGRNVFSAHREHIYQRITPTTGMHRRTSNLYYGVSVVAGFAALLVGRGGASMLLAGITLALACCAFLAALPRLIKLVS
jgi:UDP-N-acetylmuramyl pentapeptide phosphotransferase/UDP-N-acetylglucosamine-1-phosphate transferase